MKNPIVYLCVLYCITTISYANVIEISPEKRNRLDQLGKLNLEELSKVEIKLEDAFDVFGGLVQAKKITVATGVKQYTDRAPSVTTVITAQDIEAMGARTLEEVLRSVPGLQISYNWFNVPMYVIRGISSAPGSEPELLVLLNGIRVNDSFTGSKGIYWSGVSINELSRIEIIRGPGSAVYGADAFAGVINLITKTAQDIQGTEVGLRLGNLNTKDAWILHGNQWNGFDIALMAEFNSTDGNQRIVESDAQTIWDQTFGTDISLAPGQYGSEVTAYDARIDIAKQQWQLRAGVYQTEDVGNGTGIGQALDPSKSMHDRRTNVDLTYHDPQLTENWDVQAQLSYLLLDGGSVFNIFPAGAFGGAYPIGYISKASESQDNAQLALSGFYRGFDNHLIRVGAGYANYDLYKVTYLTNAGLNPFTGEEISPTEIINVSDTSSTYSPEVARNNKYLFLQDTWTINKDWEFTAGVRYDDYSDFGSTTNPRLGLIWELSKDFTTKLLYGRAFRAPAFSELYNQNNPTSIGNPNLKPENMETWELAFDYRVQKNIHLSLNLFNYNIDDKITIIPGSGSEFSYANAASWKGKGGEFELRWKTSAKSSLLFNYSYQDSQNDTSETSLNTAPQHSAFLRGDYALLPHWYLDTQIRWIDDWPRDPQDSRPSMKGYTTVDFILRRKNLDNEKINLAFGVRNLFNADIRYPSLGTDENGTINIPNDLPGMGRFIFVEFRYKFN